MVIIDFTGLDAWYKKTNYGSDDCFYWGSEKEAAEWTTRTGEELELVRGHRSGSKPAVEFNLQDELNRL